MAASTLPGQLICPVMSLSVHGNETVTAIGVCCTACPYGRDGVTRVVNSSSVHYLFDRSTNLQVDDGTVYTLGRCGSVCTFE